MATTTNFASGQEWTGCDPFAGTTAADRARNFARARRHTRFVRALRFTLPGAPRASSALYFLMIMDTTGWVGSFPKLEMPRIIPDNLTMDNPSYEGFNKDGGKYVVRAKTAIQDLVNTEFVRLNDITGDMTDAKKSKTNAHGGEGRVQYQDQSAGADRRHRHRRRERPQGEAVERHHPHQRQHHHLQGAGAGRDAVGHRPLQRDAHSQQEPRDRLRPRREGAPGAREAGCGGSGRERTAPRSRQPHRCSAAAKARSTSPPIASTSTTPDKTATFTGNVKARQGDAAHGNRRARSSVRGRRHRAQPAAPAAATPGAGTKIKRIFSKSPVVMTRAPQDRVTGSSFDYDAVNQVAVVERRCRR